MRRIERWIVPAVGGCFAVILVLMTMDYVAKHLLYLQQRDLMFEMIRGSEEYESIKKTVSYLQGTATRRLNQIIDAAAYFGMSFGVLYFLMWGRFYKRTRGGANEDRS